MDFTPKSDGFGIQKAAEECLYIQEPMVISEGQ